MYQNTEWKDHVTEFPNRRKIVDNGDGTSTVTKDQGQIIQQGTPQSATNFNNIETGILDAHVSVGLLANLIRQNKWDSDAEIAALRTSAERSENLQRIILKNEAAQGFYVTRTATPANPVTISDGADSLPVKSLSAAVSLTQSGSGDPAPDNIRPISGLDSVTVTRARKNLIHITNPKYSNAAQAAGLSVAKDTPEPGAFTVNGTNTTSGFAYITYDINLLPGDYILTGCPKNGRTGGWSQVVRTYRNNAVYKSYLDYGDGMSFKVEEADERIQLLTGRFGAGAIADSLVFRPMIRLASVSDATFDYAEPVTISVSMSGVGPVCGGNLNLTTGVLTLTHAFLELDSNINWAKSGSGDTVIYYTELNNYGFPAGLPNTGIFSHFPYADITISNTVAGARFTGNASSFRLWIRPFHPDDFPDVGTFKSWIAGQYNAGTPVQAVYPIAAPVTYRLTPTEITTLAGNNTIFSNAGKINVIYRADPALTTLKADDVLETSAENADLRLQELSFATSITAIHAAQLDRILMEERHKITLTNTLKFPFNSTLNSPVTIALDKVRDNAEYTVETEILSHDGPSGEIEITAKARNGFKISYSGSGSSLNLLVKVKGGMS